MTLPGLLPRLKKYQTALIIAIFLLYAAIGFYLANEVRLYFMAPPAIAEPTPAILYPQRNFIIIHVDNLSRQRPQLVSIWALFTVFSEPPSLAFKPLYPKLVPFKQSNPLSESFALTEYETLSPDFISELNKFNFDYEGYILLDQYAILALSGWITGETPQIAGEIANNPEQAWNLVAGEQALLDLVCERLVIPAEKRGPAIRWRDLTPNHLRTNLSFETVITSWDAVITSVSPPGCRVVGISRE